MLTHNFNTPSRYFDHQNSILHSPPLRPSISAPADPATFYGTPSRPARGRVGPRRRANLPKPCFLHFLNLQSSTRYTSYAFKITLHVMRNNLCLYLVVSCLDKAPQDASLREPQRPAPVTPCEPHSIFMQKHKDSMLDTECAHFVARPCIVHVVVTRHSAPPIDAAR